LMTLLAVAALSPRLGRPADAQEVRTAVATPAPVLVRNVNDARTPVQVTVAIAFLQDHFLAIFPAVQVPPKKRFVLEDISVQANVPAGQQVLEAGVDLGGPRTPVVYIPVTFAGPALDPA